MVTAPLLNRPPDAAIAYIAEPLQALPGFQGVVTAKQFLHHVQQLARLLPEQKYVINLCENRYLFMVAMCAAIVREQTNLLPANRLPETQKNLAQRYSAVYVLRDGAQPIDGIADFLISDQCFTVREAPPAIPVPDIPNDQLAAICFTSGSTGESKPVGKYWHTLVVSSAINARYMLGDSTTLRYELATVPAQHMWGLETSVLLALFANVCVADVRPLFAHDIERFMQQIPSPRMLVSTPLHLRAIINSDVQLDELAIVLCATSPLDSKLASQFEAKYQTSLKEVYGCSEVGSMSIRETAKTDVWRLFAGICFTPLQGNAVEASAEHVPDKVVLNDYLQMLSANTFRLLGRTSDLVDIAGKRSSLAAINQVLMRYETLVDGVVLFPPQKRKVPRLVAIVVLPEGDDKQNLVAHFRQSLDPAFVPRPIFVVDELPRQENGKLSQKGVLALYQSLSAE